LEKSELNDRENAFKRGLSFPLKCPRAVKNFAWTINDERSQTNFGILSS
jgi:hypothetical protein